jgi:hypothetical protein
LELADDSVLPAFGGVRAGDVLGGRWQLLGELGRGARGVVFRALDTSVDEVVALRLMARDGSTEAVRSELSAARRLRHAGLLRVHDLVDVDVGYAVSMELVDGESLRARVGRGPRLPSRAVTALAEELATAVAAAHQVGVVHRELRLEHILLRSDGSAVITEPALIWRDDPSLAGAPGRELQALGRVLDELAAGTRVGPALRRVLERCASDGFASTGELRAALRRRRPARVWWGGLAVVGASAAVVAAALITRSAPLAPLPAHDRRVALEVSALDPDDAALVPAVTAMARHELSARASAFEVVDDPDRANVRVALTFRSEPGAVRMRAQLIGAAGDVLGLDEASYLSVGGGLHHLFDRVEEQLAAGQPERPADERERATMAWMGTSSVTALRAYQRAVDFGFSAESVDADEGERLARLAIRADPSWLPPHLALFLTQPRALGVVTLRAARDLAPLRPRPPGEQALLDGFAQRILDHTNAEALRLGRQLHREHPDDVLAAWLLYRGLSDANLEAERIALGLEMLAARPDLQFGGDVVSRFLDLGAYADVDTLLTEWSRRAPESQEPAQRRVQLDLRARRFARAEARMRELVRLHGEQADLLLWLCDQFFLAGRYDTARELAERTMRGSETHRSLARQRLGALAALGGQLGLARQSLERELLAWERDNMDTDFVATYEALRGIAEKTGDRDAAARYVRAEATHAAKWNPERVPELRYELAQLEHPRACPALEPFLEGSASDLRASARTFLRRAAAGHGCLPCADILPESALGGRASPISEFYYARCAIAEGEGERVDRLFAAQRAENWMSYAAPIHFVELHLLRGADLERRGRLAEARAHYEVVSDLWGNADLSLPEVAEARGPVALRPDRRGLVTERRRAARREGRAARGRVRGQGRGPGRRAATRGQARRPLAPRTHAPPAGAARARARSGPRGSARGVGRRRARRARARARRAGAPSARARGRRRRPRRSGRSPRGRRAPPGGCDGDRRRAGSRPRGRAAP